MSKKFPPYPRRPHKTGLARISISGRHVYLGKFGSQESWTKYRQELARWQGGALEVLDTGRSVAWLVSRWLAHVGAEVDAGHLGKLAVRDNAAAFHAVLALYGGEQVERFGPRQLIDVGEAMLSGSWISSADKDRRSSIGARSRCSRQTVNHRLRRIKKAFRWAASRELIPWEVYHRLATVEGFRVSRSAPDTADVQPVDPAIVEATLPYLGPVTQAMVRIQQYTGMRSGEVCALMAEQIDRKALAVDGVPVWVYRPTHDKQAHKRAPAPIAFGPRAQEILAPMIAAAEPGKPLFSPLAEMLALADERHAAARYPRKRRGFVRRTFKDGYTVGAYYKRIRAACKRGGIPHWHPYQLRHLAEVTVERAFNLDAARAVLRHKDAKTTTRYGIVDLQTAARVAAKIG